MSSGPDEIRQEKEIREVYEEIDNKIDLLFSLSLMGRRKDLAKKKINKLKDKLNNYDDGEIESID